MKITPSLLLFAVLLFCVSCNKSAHFGKVLKLNGAAEMYVGSQWKPLKKSGTVDYHDTIRSTSGTVQIGFRNNGSIVLEPNTRMVVIDSTFNGKSYIFPIVVSGGILCDVKHDSTEDFSFVVYTPVAYAGAQGTHFHVAHAPVTATSSVEVFDGNVVVYNTADFSEPVQLVPGFTTTIVGTARPYRPAKIKYPHFRKVGYLFEADDCERYEVAFGFPVGPIPFPGALIVPVPVEVPVVMQESSPPPQAPRKGKHRSHSNVNVNVNIDGSFPGFSGMPVPVPVVPVPMHHGNVPVPPMPVPVPVPVPMGIMPVPVPMPGAGISVSGSARVQAGRSGHVSRARSRHD